MDMENTSGMTAPCTRVSGLKTKSMEVEFTFGLMEENTTGSGRIIICMEKVFIHGKTEECIKGIMKTIESTVMEYILGMMESNMRVGGKMESNMVKAFTEKMAVTEEESGRMEKESNGSMMLNGMTEEETNYLIMMMVESIICELKLKIKAQYYIFYSFQKILKFKIN
jgi:hypothetical protein